MDTSRTVERLISRSLCHIFAAEWQHKAILQRANLFVELSIAHDLSSVGIARYGRRAKARHVNEVSIMPKGSISRFSPHTQS